MKDPKNEKKTVEELKSIVAKNLAKDPNFYVKDGQFGVKGLGYSVDHPGLGESKPATGKYKSSGYGNINEGLENNELMAAKDRAKRNSEEGYVQHVNKTENGYEVSDWYDSDTTVCSYEDGREINSREDMFGDEEYANDLDNYDDEMYNQSYQWDDENPDLRDLGANPKLYEEMISGVDYDATSAAEIKAKVGDLKKIAPYVLELGNKVTQDNRGKITVFDEGKPVKTFNDVAEFLKAIGYGATKLQEAKLRSIISQLIKEELDMTEIESYGDDAKKKAMNKKIDEELTKRKRKLKALTTLTELEEDTVNPLKLKELQADIKKLEAYKKKMNKVKGGKKKAAKQEEEITDAMDPQLKDIEKKKEELEKREASVLNKPGVQST
jgi:hypothetical protein